MRIRKLSYLSLAALLVMGAASCRDTAAPSSITLAGEYVGVAVNGSRLPADMSPQTQLVADTLRFVRAGVVIRGMTTRKGSPPGVDNVSDTGSYRVTNRTIQTFYPCGPLNACAAGPEGTFIDLEMITMLDGNNKILYVRSR